ncbi:MAG: hypothetical protein JST80_09415 [Bdellovibrionales bacterium]|nr:hypothetical protein [Bdellovibrionales bacterium]
MKLLFVDNSAELQQKWIEPLRADGWGALRARSAEDADRMLMFHGDSIEVVVVHESMVKWAEAHDYAFVVLTKTWGDKEVIAHQNSKRSAFFYQKIDGRVQDLQTAIHSYRSGGPSSGDKKEATKWEATKTIALEDFTSTLTKPEQTLRGTASGGESSIKLEAPQVMFGGEKTNTGLNTPKQEASAPAAPAAMKVELAAPEAPKKDFPSITLEDPQITASGAHTQPKQSGKSKEIPVPVVSSMTIALELDNSNGDKTAIRPVDRSKLQEAAAINTAVDKSLPEVTEVKLDDVKLDLEAPTRIYEPAEDKDQATRISIEPPTKSMALDRKAADPTMVLEATKLELTIEKGEEVPAPLNALTGEQELIDELSLNEAVGMSQIVNSNRVSSGQSYAPPPPPVVRVLEGDEALKNYLALREQDVAVLTGQIRSGQERIQQLELQLKVEKARAIELQHTVQKQEQTLKNFNNDKQVEVEVLYRQVEDLNQQLQERSNKAHTIEAKLKITTDEVNKVKERVRVDIRRIRVREKELESQLEVLKKDSTALLQARDEKILELKRKLDLLEFNMELIQEQYNKERQQSEDLRNRLKDAAKAMRQANGLLEQ